jgi:hypothetical protein
MSGWRIAMARSTQSATSKLAATSRSYVYLLVMLDRKPHFRWTLATACAPAFTSHRLIVTVLLNQPVPLATRTRDSPVKRFVATMWALLDHKLILRRTCRPRNGCCWTAVVGGYCGQAPMCTCMCMVPQKAAELLGTNEAQQRPQDDQAAVPLSHRDDVVLKQCAGTCSAKTLG